MEPISAILIGGGVLAVGKIVYNAIVNSGRSGGDNDHVYASDGSSHSSNPSSDYHHYDNTDSGCGRFDWNSYHDSNRMDNPSQYNDYGEYTGPGSQADWASRF